MAAAAITLSGTIFLVDSIQRIATKGTGTTIFYGSPRGGGSTLLETDVTENLATVVTALGDAVIPLTVVTNGVGVVNYFPLNAIKGIRASVASPINAAVLIGAPSGNGASIGEVFVTETAAAIQTLLNTEVVTGVTSVRIGTGVPITGAVTIPIGAGGVSSLALGGGAATTGAVSIPANSTAGTGVTLLTSLRYMEMTNQLSRLSSESYFYQEDWSITELTSDFGPASFYSFLISNGTAVTTKTLDINANLFLNAYQPELLLMFKSSLTTLTLNFPINLKIIEMNSGYNDALRSTLVLTSVKSLRLRFSVGNPDRAVFVEVIS